MHLGRCALTLLVVATGLTAPACSSPSTGLVPRSADAAALVDVGADAGGSVSASPDATVPDAAVPGAERDGGTADASVPDADAPPTSGCFAAERTLVTATSVGGARAHLAPSLLIARDQGWVVLYEGPGGGHALFLGPDGERLGEEELYFARGQRAFLLGDALVGLGKVGLQRVDLGSSRVERSYLGVDVPFVLSAAGLARPGVVRRVGLYYVGNTPQFRVTDVELSNTTPTGFALRSATLEGTATLGYLSTFRPHVRGELLQLLGTGVLTAGPWRAVVLALPGTPAVPEAPLPWSVVQNEPWALGMPPEVVFAQTDDGRWAVVQRGELAEVEALPEVGLPPRLSPPLFVPGQLRQVLDSDGRLSLLFGDRLLVLDPELLDGTGSSIVADLAFQGADAQAAQRADRAGVVYVAGDPGDSVRLILRCTALAR